MMAEGRLLSFSMSNNLENGPATEGIQKAFSRNHPEWNGTAADAKFNRERFAKDNAAEGADAPGVPIAERIHGRQKRADVALHSRTGMLESIEATMKNLQERATSENRAGNERGDVAAELVKDVALLGGPGLLISNAETRPAEQGTVTAATEKTTVQTVRNAREVDAKRIAGNATVSEQQNQIA